MPQKIYVVEDHPAMREAYAQLFGRVPDLELCGEASCGEDALAQISTCRPDLVLVDISLPKMSGFDLINELKTREPSLPMLIVSGHDRSAYQDLRLEGMVRGYVMKADGAHALVRSIRQVLTV